MVRIGAGAGFAGDRIDPAVDLAKRGKLDVLAFECVAERTLAYGHLARMADPGKGYHALIDRRLGAVLADCVKNGTTIVTGFSGYAAMAAGAATRESAAHNAANNCFMESPWSIWLERGLGES